MNRKFRLLLVILALFMFVGCDENVAEMTDEAFYAYTFGKGEENPATTLSDVKNQFPKYTQEFAWHRKGDESIPANRNQVILVYKTRNGNFYFQFDDQKLVYKRKT